MVEVEVVHDVPSPISSGSSEFLKFLSIFIWLGGIHVNVFVCLVAIFNLPSTWAITVLALWAALVFMPVGEDSRFGHAVGRFICRHAPGYFPMTVHIDEGAQFDPQGSHVFGVEPHSVLPLGLLAIAKFTNSLPLPNARALASSVVFLVPIVRHVVTWLGLAPANRASFRRLLAGGGTVLLVPGGVQECLVLQHGEEVVFLKQRLGFVKLAMEGGAALVPCFCFGQTGAYRWWKPSGPLYERFSRAVGFAPILFWGRYGTFFPFCSPMYFAIGKPLVVEKVERPSPDQVSAYHQRFVEAMADLFERHKGSAGYANLKLRIL